MQGQPDLDTLSFKVKIAKASILNRNKFQNLVETYIHVLEEKQQRKNTLEVGESLEEEIRRQKKELEVSYLINPKEFSIRGVLEAIDLVPEEYLQTIIYLEGDNDYKRKLISQHFVGVF